MTGIPTALHLTESELKMFMNTYKQHMSAIGTEECDQYAIRNITKVKRNIPERCFEVYFKNGEWFKYYTNGTLG
ncbi:hypothetical protein SAMN04487943_101339 [Gracilibacillus orientalis]|uniref:Uncharacterized protein n=1 Tax=Gracilibacillus orientalis TaxID=334253 RepID=A0A1I4HBE1_9BACI|nr:hypothetical protein SAMN04487943_101339 [Gracilibacillus orientalis]